MKKTLTVNLNGRVYTIDEDAYRLLDSYLSNIRIFFQKEEGGAEIINDFEARIEELFSEKTRLGYQVITLEHVEEVIARVGKPADFTTNDGSEQRNQSQSAESVKTGKKFFRNIDDKVLGGVCSGIATYFDWNTAVIRVALVLLPFIFSTFKIFNGAFLFGHSVGSFWGWIISAYIVAWIIIPAARTVEQKLQMKGQPVTVENIGKTVAAQSEPITPKEPKGCLSGFADVIIAIAKAFIIGLGCLIALPLLFALFIVIIVLFAVFFGVGGGLLGAMPFLFAANHPVLSTIMGVIVLGIPVFALFYLFISYLAKWKPLHQSIKWGLLLIWIAALAVLLTSGFRLRFNSDKWNNRWSWSRFADMQEIRGNGVLTQKTIDFDEAVTSLETGNFLCANLQIEQTEDETTSIEINGDENLVEQVRIELKNGRLVLSALNKLRCENNLNILLRTKDVTNIQMNSVTKIRINRAFTGDELKVKINGVGNFYADSMYVSSLTVRSEGVGSANISGKAGKVRLETAGVGKIDAMELLSDTVYAKVDGVGSIQCNPVEYFEGRSHGVGSITYKDEPKHKDTGSFGVGIIRKK